MCLLNRNHKQLKMSKRFLNQSKHLDGQSVSEVIIREKARLLHSDLIQEMFETCVSLSDFQASRSRFEIHSHTHVTRHNESANLSKSEMKICPNSKIT